MLRFNEFRSTSIQEAYRDTIDIDIRTYYVYFIVYPSPTNPKQSNLYIGVKHLDSGSDSEHYASNFFGGIRSSGSGNFFTDGSGSTFENFLIGFNEKKNKLVGNNNKSLSDNNSLLYMSSCKDPQEEALKHAYAKGIHGDDLVYHPLIGNNNILKFAKEKLRSGITLEYYFREKVDQFLKMFSRKKKDDDEEKEEVVKEDVSISQGTFFLPIGLGGRNETRKHLNHAKSSKYGYRVYVCDDMGKYVEKLTEIIESEKNTTLDTGSDKEGEEKGLKGERKQWSEDKKSIVDTVAKHIMIRHYDTLQQFDWFKFKSENDYMDYLRNEIEENPNPLLSQMPEKTMFGMQRKDGFDKLFQAPNAGAKVDTSEVLAKHYFGTDLTKKQTEDGLRAFNQQPGEDHPESRRRFDKLRNQRKKIEAEKDKGVGTYSSSELHSGFDKIVKETNVGANQKLAIQNFMTASNDPPTKREYGLVSKNKSIKTYFWNDENNLLKKAYENKDSSAIQEMKKSFLTYDIRLMIPENGKIGYKNKKLIDIVIPITVKGSSCFVVKQNGKLIEMKAIEVLQKGNWTKVKKEVMFNLYDFLKLIGYKNITENQKLFEFAESNNLIKESFDIIQEFTGVTDRLERSVEKTKKKPEETPRKETKTSKFRKSTQPEKADLLAIRFIESLFTKPQPYGAIFFDGGNGEQKVDIKKARELLAAPVKKLIKNK